MNTETDRDLTTEEQEQLSGGLFFRDDLSGESPDQRRNEQRGTLERVRSL